MIYDEAPVLSLSWLKNVDRIQTVFIFLSIIFYRKEYTVFIFIVQEALNFIPFTSEKIMASSLIEGKKNM